MEPPSGTVTLFFAELEGALELEQRHGPAFGEASSAWRASARRRIEARGGYEVKTTTAGIMAAFSGPGNAALCAVDLLEDSGAMPWPGGASPLREGLHTGEPILELDAATGRADYFGPAVNRAARLAAAAHAGQALLSGATHLAAGPALDGAEVLDLGEHRLRGFDAPERIFQVLPASSRGRRFPPLAATPSLPTNLPPQTTAFVGRTRELSALAALVASGSRIVTVTGPAGCGKSRLAVRAGSAMLPRLEGGVWFAELTEASGVAGIAGAVAAAFGVTPRGGKRPEEAVGELLELRPPLLLILDTFDHLLEHAMATVGAWAARAPRAVFVLTSRAATGLPEERELRIEPLGAPGAIAHGPGAAARAAASDAVLLFVERAKEARPDFELTDDNAPDVARICADLEGLPLAVELAAARVKVLSPAEMVRKLGQKFQLLRSARQDTARRQQTLSGAIEWSWDQLNDWERSAFVQASVFPAGFCEDAASAVLDLPAHAGAPGPVAAAAALLARSLVRAVETPWGRRFSMYRPIREYAERKRAEAGPEGDAAQERFVEWCFRGARRAWNFRRTSHEPESKARLVAELENLLAAVDSDFKRGSGVPLRRGAMLVASLGWIHDDISRRQDLTSRSLLALRLLDATAPEPGDRIIRGELHLSLGGTLWGSGERDQAIPHYEKALEIARHAGDDSLLARALQGRAIPHFGLGEYQQALDLFDAVIKVSEAMGDPAGVGGARNGRGTTLIWRGDPRAALAEFESAISLFRSVGFAFGVGMARGNAGLAHKDLGNYREAETAYREAADFSKQAGYPSLLSTALGNLAGLLSDDGRYEEALAMFEEAAALDREMGDRGAALRCRANCGVVYLRQGRPAEALRLFEELDADFRRLKDPSATSTNISNMAAANRDLGHFETALRQYEESRRMDLGSGDRLGAAVAAFTIGRILFDLGRVAEAEAMLRPALDEHRELGAERTGYFVAHIGLYALVLESLGRHAEAVEAARETVQLRKVAGIQDALVGNGMLSYMDRACALAGEHP